MTHERDCPKPTEWHVTCPDPLHWTELVSRVSVGGALPIEIRVLEGLYSIPTEIVFAMTVPCVKTGEDIVVEVLRTPPYLVEEASALAWLREQIHWFYRHEADEQIKVDGVALFRPWHEHEGGK
jgi:hypothetical protein